MAKPSASRTFFLVWNTFEQRASRRVFDTRKEANTWVKRQARRNPGVEFYVCKAVAGVLSAEAEDPEPVELVD